VFLALAEIRRAKARYLLLAGAVGLLAFLILFQQVLLGGLITDFIGALRNQSAEVLVFSDQARRNVEGSAIAPEQVAAVGAVDGVARAEPIGENTFTVIADDEQVDAVVFGIEPGGPGTPTTLTEGRLPGADGEGVASSADRDAGFGIGDVVTIAPEGPEIEIVGLAKDVRYSVAPTIFVPFATWSESVLAANPDARGVLPSLVGVEPADGVDARTLAERITAEVDGVEALTRDTAVAESPGVSSVQQSFSIVLGLAYLVVTLVTGFFFLILTVQKAGSLTLLRAIGAPRGALVKALLVQVVLVLVAGVAVGALLAWLLTRVASTGVSLSLTPTTVLVTGSVLLVLAIVASVVAIRRVLRIDPIEATTGAGVHL